MINAKTPEQLAAYSMAATGWKFRDYDREEIVQQAWLLWLLHEGDKQKIHPILVRYISRQLGWRWGRGGKRCVVLMASLEFRASKGYEPDTIDRWRFWRDNPGKVKDAQRSCERQKKNRQKGLCGCGRVPDAGYKTCSRCLEKGRLSDRKRRAANPKKERARDNREQKARRAKRLAEGVCVVCGGERAEGDNRMCVRHREAERAKVARYKARKRAKAKTQQEPNTGV